MGMGSLNGKIAAVTGGASGIGEATVRRFIVEGAKVAFADRDGERGRRVVAEIVAAGGQAIFVEADVSQEAACAAFIERAVAQFGQLNVLVNNAGIRMYQTVVEASAQSWDEILGVNPTVFTHLLRKLFFGDAGGWACGGVTRGVVVGRSV